MCLEDCGTSTVIVLSYSWSTAIIPPVISQFVARKIGDLGVAKVIKADSKKTKTHAPGTVHGL